MQQPGAIAALRIKVEQARQRMTILRSTQRHGPLFLGVVSQARIAQLRAVLEYQPKHQVHALARTQSLQSL